METREITLQLVLAFLFGAILLNLGLRGRVGSGMAAIFAPDKLQEGDFSGGNTQKGGSSPSSSLWQIILGVIDPFQAGQDIGSLLGK